MSTANNEINSDEIIDLDILLDHYDKLNKITNSKKYPWNLKTQQWDKSYILTYKNIKLYYDPKKIEKMLQPQKSKKGGNATNSLPVRVYLF